ncbi:methyl-accepting chemotaxis protein [Novosphingobium sp.]|uniref:methyl-accepting chemotaxis protein n=1 Tax=Novosphingobium sp. TaxID=1874826 RepID=UPI0035B277F4
MLNWFEQHAPIRTKFKVLLAVQAACAAAALLATVMAAHGLASATAAVVLCALAGATGTGALALAARLICTPYVNTVVRMEALAAGDTDSEIRYTDYTDCVGRMTKAMAAFRNNAIAVKEASEAQEHIVRELGAGLAKLGQNDLDCRIEQPFAGASDTLRQNFNKALDQLASTLEAVRSSANAVLNGATEIRAASDDLSLRNEQQAASLEETAASMNQVTGVLKETADRAIGVRETIDTAHHEANDGGAVVKRAIEAMAGIERSSQEINQIISVIDGIAFQTNLLALNAGVEAARAGDAGKGFAVVANEVRALAQRSADAAKDIKALITASTQQVGEGVTLVGETGSLLEKIVQRVGEIAGLMSEIATSTQNQSVNLQQVNSAMGDMDRMTQQNAAMVEQSTAAARSLADEAAELNRIVAAFRLAGGGARSGAGVAAPAVLPTARSVRRQAPPPVIQGNLAVKAEPHDDWSEF